MKTSHADTAKRNPTTHAFRLGIGYIDYGGEPKLRNGLRDAPPVVASAPMIGSIHLLKSPQGAIVPMKWTGQAWDPMSTHGNRLAYTPSFLGRARWSYVGPQT